MKFTKGGFDASIRDKLFGRTNRQKSSRFRAKADQKAERRSRKNSAKAERKAKRAQKFEQAKQAAQTRKAHKEQKKQIKLDKKLSNIRNVINENTKIGQMIQNKYGITDLDKWLTDYAKYITGFIPTFKNLFQRSANKKLNVDFVVKKYIKHPTINNLTNMEAKLNKVMDPTSRKAYNEFKVNMGKYLPIGLAAGFALSATDD